MYGESIRNHIPAELDAVVNRFENNVGDLRTRLIRQEATITRPEHEAADPERVRAAAEAEDASPELKALAAAVAKGRTTWADAVAGKADQLPEVQALYTSVRERMVAELANEDKQPGEEPESNVEGPAQRPKVPKAGLDEDFAEPGSYMYMPKVTRGTHTGWQTGRDDEQGGGILKYS